MRILPLLLVFATLTVLQSSDAFGQFGGFGDITKKIKRDIERATKSAEDAAKKATEQKATEERKRAEVVAAKAAEEQRRKAEATARAKADSDRLKAIPEANKLRDAAQKLAKENQQLSVELQNQKDDLDEARRQLEAEKSLAVSQQLANEETANVLKEEKRLLDAENTALEDRAFLYSMGFWTSLGAVAIGCISLALHFPTIKLEREKLRHEIALLAIKLTPQTATSAAEAEQCRAPEDGVERFEMENPPAVPGDG